MTIVIMKAEDWVGLYKDGRLLDQGHSISLEQGLRLLGIDYRAFEQEPEEGDVYPDHLGEA